MKKPHHKSAKEAKDDNEPELFEKVVHINRCAKVVKGGRRFSFAALVVVGDQAGNVGFGYGKAQMVPDAIRKGTDQAKKAMRHVSISGDTLPHPVLGTHDGGKVMLRPARQGTGIIAGGGVRAVLEAAGVKNVLSKSLGSNNQLSVVSATLDGLLQLRTASQISEIRGETVFGPAFTQEQPKVQLPVETKSE
jgi:small subunit ribosomal protein S5